MINIVLIDRNEEKGDSMIFHDRNDAGRQLLPLLESFRTQNNLIILGLARGGVVVAYEVAKGLNAPLNVVVPRKIGSPGNPELAIGAIMEDGEGVFNDRIIRLLHVSQDYIIDEIEKEKTKAHQRLSLFRKNAPLPNLKNSTVILVDDGIATGATMLAAIKSIRKSGAEKIIVAVPVAAPESLSLIEHEVDNVICLYAPDDLGAIGYYYENFDQTEDSEVLKLIEKAKECKLSNR